MKNPYVTHNMLKLKVILPVGKQKAWDLIATPKGIASWLAASCTGRVGVGNLLELGWPDRRPEKLRVLSVGERRSSFHLQWRNGGRLRYYLHGRLTTLTLELEFPRKKKGKEAHDVELAQWAFFLANLKSVALGGPDLRNGISNRSWHKGFID